ncbi:hypothetical protein PUATCC27989T_03336 [Phytobacter ursingii]|nr:hypothetical protein PUATCC27989T_03336 [Phytobacter ursingii]
MEANGERDGLTEQQIDDKIAGSAQYKEVDKEYGVGSDFWRNGTALTGLLAGALGGNVTGGMAAGAAPYVAGLIKSVADGHESARIALHTLASAVLVQLQGGNTAAGAAGGFIASSGSEALSLAFYNKEPDKLSPDEKTVIVNLVAALGAAGGSVAAGNSSGTGSGANAARVEVENNSLGSVAKAAEKAFEGCMKNATCRSGMNQMGISIGLTNSQIEEAMKAGATRDPAIIAKLTPEQIAYLDAQIKSGAGMAGLILGNITWGDRLDKTVAVDPNDIPKLEGLPIPNEPGETALVNPVPERDKNDGIYITPEQKQDKDAGILPGAEINTGNWRDNILTSNDVESSWHQVVLIHLEIHYKSILKNMERKLVQVMLSNILEKMKNLINN